ncbi:MAG: sensor histidine kinase [Flavobacteriales bacterium]|nr:sensor histidine kinase [Flavobacteriales bacterium]
MSTVVISKLAELIRQHKEALLKTWRDQVRELPSAAGLDIPTLNDHIPALLVELADALEQPSEENIADKLRDGSPPEHGIQRFEDGFDLTEVVSEYNILRGCVHDLALDHDLMMGGRAFHVLNRVLDEAIGLAVKTHAEQAALEVKKRREEYLAFVAHDLRNPLTAISMAASLLEVAPGEQPDAEQQASLVRSLHRNVGQLEALVNKVLEENANAEAEAGLKLQRRTFDLWPHVGSTIQAMKPLAEAAGIRVSNKVPFDQVVFADASLLRRVFQNLISNAVTYSPGGEITIGARTVEATGVVECWVTDTGSGIAADRLEEVFEKGEGDPARKDSTGLGLAIVRTFVEAHGGEVAAESEEGQGTTIRFTLSERKG